MSTAEDPKAQPMVGRDIVLVSSDDYEAGLKTSKHQLTWRLTRDNRVLFVESIGLRRPSVGSGRDVSRIWRKIRRFLAGPQPRTDNLWVFTPLAIPLHERPWARKFNAWFLGWSVRRAARQLGFQRPVLWMFLPSAAGVVGRLDESVLVYYNVDHFATAPGAHEATITAYDEQLTQQADVVFATSLPLVEHKKLHNANTHYSPHGVDYDHFRQALQPCDAPPPPELADLEGPIICYWGWIVDYFCVHELADAAKARPDWNFILIGQATIDLGPLTTLPNVRILGPRPYEVLPDYARHTDVGLIPFVLDRWIVMSNPLKLREYLAAGIPVVSSAVPEVVSAKEAKYGDAVAIAYTGEELVAAIDKQLAVPKAERAEQLSALVADESWDARLRDVAEKILAAEQRKQQRQS